jgi:hypothetical protein
VVTCMVAATRGGAVTRSNVLFVARCLGAYGVVVLVHLLSRSLGYARLPIDAALYLVLVIALGALRPRQLLKAVREAVKRPRSDA